MLCWCRRLLVVCLFVCLFVSHCMGTQPDVQHSVVAHLTQLSLLCCVAACRLQSSSWLLGTRKVYREELTRDVRLLTLLRAAFFSPGKQAALGTLSRYLAMLLANIADIPAAAAAQPAPQAAASPAEEGASGVQQNEGAGAAAGRTTAAAAGGGSSDADDDQSHLSNLLRYVPVVYVEVVLDYLTALRRLDEQQAAGAASQAQVRMSRDKARLACNSMRKRTADACCVQAACLLWLHL
jgi:hypothetical protein